MNNHWTNRENSLHRLYGDGTEELCDYAGINMLTVGAGEEASRRPCSYCGEGVAPGQFKCGGCGHSEWTIVTRCQIRLEAVLPKGGRLLDLNERSVLEVRRREWFYSQSPYFMSVTDMYSPSSVEREPESEASVVIRLTGFSLINTVIDKPVPLWGSGGDCMTISMMWECEAEFLFGSREENG